MHAVEPAGRDETVENAEALGADLGPTKHPILPADRNRSDRAFEVIGVDLQLWVAQVYAQSATALLRVTDRLGERVARQELDALTLTITPLEEPVYDGPRMLDAIGALVVAGEYDSNIGRGPPPG